MTGIELEALRCFVGLTRAEAAEFAAVSPVQTWGKYETGARSVPATVADLITQLAHQREAVYKALHENATGGSMLQYEYYQKFDDTAFSSVAEWRIYQSAVSQLYAAGLCSLV